MYNKPRRPYYDWSSNTQPKVTYNDTNEHQVIESKRFWQLWRQLRSKQDEARSKRDEAKK